MAANGTPGFCKNGTFGTPKDVTAANTVATGVSTIATDSYLLFTADATNGSLVEFVRIMPTASAANTNTVATVIRFFVSTVASGATTAANTHCIYEVAIPIISASSSTLANNPIDVPLNLRLPASATLLATTHIAAAANTFWKCSAFGGDY